MVAPSLLMVTLPCKSKRIEAVPDDKATRHCINTTELHAMHVHGADSAQLLAFGWSDAAYEKKGSASRAKARCNHTLSS